MGINERAGRKIVTTKWNDTNIDFRTIGVIFILEDGSFLYGKIDKEILDQDDELGHNDIFEQCVEMMNITALANCNHQMEYAHGLASDEINIVNIQIIPNGEIICALNKNSTDEQLEKLYFFVDYLSDNNTFSADILYDNKIKNIYNKNNDDIINLGLPASEFKKQLEEVLNSLKETKGHSK